MESGKRRRSEEVHQNSSQKRRRRIKLGIKPSAFEKVFRPNLKIPKYLKEPGEDERVLAGYLFFLSNHSNVCGIIETKTFFEFSPFTLVWSCSGLKDPRIDKRMRALTTSQDFFLLLKNCLNESSKRFVIIPLRLVSITSCRNPDNKDHHSNLIVIDKKNKTFERFEPNGGNTAVDPFWFDSQQLNHHLELLFREQLRDGFRMIPPTDVCPSIGIQSLQADEEITTVNKLGGFCAMWSLWYLELRISNPDIPSKELLTQAIEEIKKEDDDFTKFIVNYTIFIKDISELLKDQSIDYLLKNLSETKEFFRFKTRFRNEKVAFFEQNAESFKESMEEMLDEQDKFIKFIENNISVESGELEHLKRMVFSLQSQISNVFSVSKINTFQELDRFLQHLKEISEINLTNVESLLNISEDIKEKSLDIEYKGKISAKIDKISDILIELGQDIQEIIQDMEKTVKQASPPEIIEID